MYDQLEGLLRKYITSLLQNIEDRFAESKQTLQAFSIFDPCNVPKENEPGFLTYGDKHIAALADFLYDGIVSRGKWFGRRANFKGLAYCLRF